jgi:predicted DsbA family dithiol-disulfide isomerase
VVCPWCNIDKRRFEKTLGPFDGRESVEGICWSYELDQVVPNQSDMTLEELLATKYGMSGLAARKANERVTQFAAQEGLELRIDLARPTNTLDPHRILQPATVRHIRPVV